ncbi:MAG: hypothetical protein ACP5H5_05280 [Pyrobaculum sp.]
MPDFVVDLPLELIWRCREDSGAFVKRVAFCGVYLKKNLCPGGPGEGGSEQFL